MPAKKAAARSTAKKRGRKPGTTMSADHKAALAAGRESSRAVRAYLNALESHKPKRGRKRTPESIAARLSAIEDRLAVSDPITRLNLIQEQIDLNNELDAMQQTADISALETAFCEQAKTYSENKGISYTAWRSIGVPAEVLKRANISR